MNGLKPSVIDELIEHPEYNINLKDLGLTIDDVKGYADNAGLSLSDLSEETVSSSDELMGLARIVGELRSAIGDSSIWTWLGGGYNGWKGIDFQGAQQYVNNALAKVGSYTGSSTGGGGGESGGGGGGTFTPTQYKGPRGHASGTPSFEGGWTRINEEGGELAYLPGGTAIIPADKTDRILTGGSSYSISIVNNVQGIPDEASIQELNRRLEETIKRIMREENNQENRRLALVHAYV